MTQVQWTHCEGGHCTLTALNLDHPHFTGREGVYVIWRGGTNPAVVRLGQGNIKDRIGKHRLDREILKHGATGTLHVTWADVPTSLRNGIERFLANTLRPLVGDAFPLAQPVPVNLPW